MACKASNYSLPERFLDKCDHRLWQFGFFVEEDVLSN